MLPFFTKSLFAKLACINCHFSYGVYVYTSLEIFLANSRRFSQNTNYLVASRITCNKTSLMFCFFVYTQFLCVEGFLERRFAEEKYRTSFQTFLSLGKILFILLPTELR
jgi:hypothetical protein